MRKRLPLIIFIFLINFIVLPTAHAAFPDVPSSHPYADSISYVQANNYVSGYTDGTFQPDKSINRAEFTKILIEAVAEDKDINTCPKTPANLFSDVPKSEWFAKYVCLAKVAEIISGYPDGSFSPGQEINFAEASKIFVFSFGFQVEAGIGETWYTPFTDLLKAFNSVPPSVKSPGQLITRGEMADIMYHFKSTIDGNPPPSNVQACDSSKFLSHGEFKQRVIDLVNHERNKAGLGPLVNNCYLEKTAQGHSDDMMNRDYFDHNTPEGVSPEQRIDQSGYLTSYYECLCSKSQTTGENIAVGQTNPEEVVDTWMNSPPHRANILNTTFSEIGIGITDVPKSNKEYEGYYWVQNFGDIQLNE